MLRVRWLAAESRSDAVRALLSSARAPSCAQPQVGNWTRVEQRAVVCWSSGGCATVALVLSLSGQAPPRTGLICGWRKLVTPHPLAAPHKPVLSSVSTSSSSSSPPEQQAQQHALDRGRRAAPAGVPGQQGITSIRCHQHQPAGGALPDDGARAPLLLLVIAASACSCSLRNCWPTRAQVALPAWSAQQPQQFGGSSVLALCQRQQQQQHASCLPLGMQAWQSGEQCSEGMCDAPAAAAGLAQQRPRPIATTRHTHACCVAGGQARSMFIQTQPTPNPQSLMFLPGRQVMEVRRLRPARLASMLCVRCARALRSLPTRPHARMRLTLAAVSACLSPLHH